VKSVASSAPVEDAATVPGPAAGDAPAEPVAPAPSGPEREERPAGAGGEDP
jgi:hypothetical protein